MPPPAFAMLFSSAVWFASGASLNTSIVLMVTFCWPRAELTSVVNKYLAHSSAYRATLLAGGAGGRDVGVTAMTVFVPVTSWFFLLLPVQPVALPFAQA